MEISFSLDSNGGLEDYRVKAIPILLYNNGSMPNCFTTSRLNALCEMKQMESELPISLPPKFKEIGSYLTSMEKEIENIDSTIEKIETKFEEFRKRKYKVAEDEKTELKMLKLDLNGDFAAAEMYGKRVEEALPSLNDQSGVNLTKECVSATVSIGAASARGYHTVPNAPVVGAFLSGVEAFLHRLLSVGGKYEEHNKAYNEFKTQLKILKAKIETQKIRSEIIDEKVGLLT